jgi:two-component sensor histidine kinase
VVVHDPEGRQVVNTYGDLQQERGEVNKRLLEEIINTKQPAYGLVWGRTVGDWLVVVMAPVLRDGAVAETVSVTVRAAEIANLVSPMMEPPFSARLITKSGQIVARSDRHNEFVGRQVVDGFVQAGYDGTRWRKEGTWRGANASGESDYAVYRRIDAAGWIAVVSAPEMALAASWQLSLTFMVLLALVLAVLLLVAYDLQWRIEEADARIRKAHDELTRAYDGQALEIREYEHRIGNYFTAISNLITMSERRAQSKEDLAHGLLERVAAYTRLLKYEYKGGNLRELVEMFLAPHKSEGHPVHMDGPEILLGPQAMKSLGLVLHELTTNAVKYGPFYGPEGSITIRWEQQSARLVLWWHEVGINEVRPSTRSGFGSYLLKEVVVRQLRGSCNIEYEPKGLCYIFTLPLESLSR